MAIRRKNSRSINVDGVSFRWTISARSQAKTGKVLLIIKCDQRQDAGIVVRSPEEAS